jgi:glycosyltransferase involved in cell wall biosynthesis
MEMEMNNCVIVIPCYNEGNRLDTTVFTEFMLQNPAIKFIFVNDGSSDNTGEVLKQLCRNTSSSYIELANNSGKAEAIRQGMLAIRGDDIKWVGFWDADLATPLDEILRMLNTANEKTLYLSGCRLLRLGGQIQRKWYRHLLGRLFATVIAWRLRLAVYDTQCGAKLFAASEKEYLFREKFITHWFFDVEILQRFIKRYGHSEFISRSVEVPLNSWKDVSESKLRYFTCLKDFIKLLWNSK